MGYKIAPGRTRAGKICCIKSLALPHFVEIWYTSVFWVRGAGLVIKAEN